MRRWLWILVVLGIAARVDGFGGIGVVTMNCPICGRTFQSPSLGSEPTYAENSELRPTDITVLGQQWLHTCPNDYYTGFRDDFTKGPDTPALPDLLKIRDMLAAARKRGLPPAEGLFQLEKVALAERVWLTRAPSAEKLSTLYLMGAWLGDDTGEDALATAYRRKAIGQLTEVVAAGAANDTNTWVARYRLAILPQAIGQGDKAVRDLAGFAKAAANKADRLNKKIAKAKSRYDNIDDEGRFERDDAEALSGKLVELRHQAKLHLAVHRQRGLSEKAGLKKAQAGDFAEKRGFLRVHGAGRSAATRAFIQKLLKQPLGPPNATTGPKTRPAGGETGGLFAGNRREALFPRSEKEEALNLINRDLQVAHGDGPCPWLLRPRSVKELGQLLAKAPDAEPIEGSLANELFPKPDDWYEFDEGGDGGSFEPEEDPLEGWSEDTIFAAMAAMDGAEPAVVLLADLARRPNQYYQLRSDYKFLFLDADEVMARNEGPALMLTKRLWGKLAAKEPNAMALTASMGPLAFTTGDESLTLLKELARAKVEDVRLMAAMCLIMRGEPVGKDILLAEAAKRKHDMRLSDRLEVRLARLLTKDDLPRLRRLANKSKTQAYWLLGGIARLDPAGGTAAYEKRVGLTLALKMLRTPATAPGDRDKLAKWLNERMIVVQDIAEAARIYCTVPMARHMVAEARAIEDDWCDNLGDVIRGIGSCPASVRPEASAFLVELLKRPTRLDVKLAIIEVSPKISAPPIDAAIRMWSSSRNPVLAKAAKKRLATARAAKSQSGSVSRASPLPL